jgi:hypothetical protein
MEETCIDPHSVKSEQIPFIMAEKKDPIPTELMKAMTEFFAKLQEDGMLSIALCDNEKGRMKMLHLLQHASREEIKFKHMLNHITDNAEVILTENGEVNVEDLENTGSEFQTVDVKKTEND